MDTDISIKGALLGRYSVLSAKNPCIRFGDFTSFLCYIFLVNAVLSVNFDYGTEILLDDGTIMVFNPREPHTNAIGWKEGTIVTVKFMNYDECRNSAYVSYVKVAD